MPLDHFSPIQLGPYALRNRIVMAPLTRSRAGEGNVPHALNALYYAQRASAALIVSEATQVSAQGQGYIATPGIHTAEQTAGWKNETYFFSNYSWKFDVTCNLQVQTIRIPYHSK